MPVVWNNFTFNSICFLRPISVKHMHCCQPFVVIFLVTCVMVNVGANFDAGVNLDVYVDFYFILFRLLLSILKHIGYAILRFHGFCVGKDGVSLN
jgi:hypothetical protein